MSRRDDGVTLRQLVDHAREVLTIDADILWKVVMVDVPALVASLEQLGLADGT